METTSTLFVHRGALYLLGTDKHHGNAVLRRSTDGGLTWTSPTNGATGLLRDNGQYHCAPVPVLEHGGRLWRAMEWRQPPEAWGVNYRAGMMSVPVDADLLDASQWKFSSFLPSNRAWNGGDMGAWLEGNAVLAPDGQVVDVLRVQTQSPEEKAAIVRISPDGQKASFDPVTGFVAFPGGAKKFTIRFDPQTRLYWSLASIVHERHRAENPGGIRNTLALTCSPEQFAGEVAKQLDFIGTTFSWTPKNIVGATRCRNQPPDPVDILFSEIRHTLHGPRPLPLSHPPSPTFSPRRVGSGAQRAYSEPPVTRASN